MAQADHLPIAIRVLITDARPRRSTNPRAARRRDSQIRGAFLPIQLDQSSNSTRGGRARAAIGTSERDRRQV